MKVERETQKTRTLDTVHAPLDDGFPIRGEQSLIVCALKVVGIIAACIELSQLIHFETSVNVLDEGFNQNEFLEVCFGFLVRAGHSPLVPKYSVRNWRCINSEDRDARRGHLPRGF